MKGTTARSARKTFDAVDRFVLKAMRDAARRNARRVARTLGLTKEEIEDAEQDILLELLERWRHFDATRGPWQPFANLIARQAAQLVADRIVAQRRLFAAPAHFSGQADQPEETSIAEVVADERAWSETDLVVASAYLSAICRLPIRQRRLALAALAADGELADARKNLGLSSSEFYRQVDELRHDLLIFGLLDPRQMASLRSRRRPQHGTAARTGAWTATTWESAAAQSLQSG